jgi:hypothetical protein
MSSRMPSDGSWTLLYSIGCALAFVYVIMVVVPLALIFSVPQPPAAGGAAVLAYIASHKAIYLIELICFVGLSIPGLGVFLAVSVSLKETNVSLAALGGLTGIVSEILALALGSSPQSLSAGLVYLSDQYIAATAEAQRAALSAAAEGFLANANAISPAGILTALGIFLLSMGMLRGVYGRWVAILGIVTGALGMVFEALRPQIGMLYGLYGILLPIWFVAIGLGLFKLGFSVNSRAR